MLHKIALLLGILCVACPLTAISESTDRETGFWLSAGLARSEIELPTLTPGFKRESQWDNWQLGVGYETKGWLDIGLQYDEFRTRSSATFVQLNAVELRVKSNLNRGSSVFLAPIVGAGWGWSSRDESGAVRQDESYMPFTYSTRGPVATVGVDLHVQPGSWLAVVFSGTYRWSRLDVREMAPGLNAEPDASLQGWSFGAQIRVYPKSSGLN